MSDQERDETDYWADGFSSDPVAKEAREFAVAATNPPKASKTKVLAERLAVGFVILLFVLSTLATVISAVNTNNISKTNKSIASTNKCLQNIVVKLTQEQTVRNDIAARDRTTVDELFQSVFKKVHTQQEFQATYKKYLAQRAANDLDRKAHPLPSYEICK